MALDLPRKENPKKNKYLRLCFKCNKNFYSEDDYKTHKCVEKKVQKPVEDKSTDDPFADFVEATIDKISEITEKSELKSLEKITEKELRKFEDKDKDFLNMLNIAFKDKKSEL